MSITTISSREFNQDAGGAKKAAEKGLSSLLTAGVRRICVSIGALARGEQKGPSFREDARD